MSRVNQPGRLVPGTTSDLLAWPPGQTRHWHAGRRRDKTLNPAGGMPLSRAQLPPHGNS